MRPASAFVCVLFLASCAAGEPEICRSSPPEDSDNYEKWLQLRREANCTLVEESSRQERVLRNRDEKRE